MALPALTNWETTRSTLHQVTQIIGAIRVASSPELENDLQYSVSYTGSGVSTTELNVGGELMFDFATFTLHYIHSDGKKFEIDASGYTQKTLMDALIDKLKSFGIEFEPSMKHITHDTPLEIDKSLAEDYVEVLAVFYTALARFRAKLSGFMTPIVMWPHHFDMSFIWFATNQTNEHEDPHLAIGFAPFSDGVERPYLYGYGWSKETGYVDVEVQPPAQAITDAYTGLYAEYDILNTDEKLNLTVEQILLAYHAKAKEALLQG